MELLWGKCYFRIRVAIFNIVCFIASEMRQRLLSFILNSKNPFYLLFDESTTMANETVLILNVRVLDPAGTFNVFMLLTCMSAVSVKLPTHGQSMTAVKDRWYFSIRR